MKPVIHRSKLSEAEPILSKDGNHWPYEKSSGTDGDLLPQEDSIQKWRGCSSFEDFGLTSVVWDGKLLNMLIQVLLRAMHKEVCKKIKIKKISRDADLTEISFSGQFKLEPTHIGLP